MGDREGRRKEMGIVDVADDAGKEVAVVCTCVCVCVCVCVKVEMTCIKKPSFITVTVLYPESDR